MDARLIKFIEKFVEAQRRATNQFALDGLADEAERLLAEVKPKAPKVPEWPRGWIYDRPFLGGSKRFRVVIQRCDEDGSIARYADRWEQARDWLKENGVDERNIVSTTRPF